VVAVHRRGQGDLILIDAIRSPPLDATGTEQFFWLVTAAHERRFLDIGSHRPFELCGGSSSPSTALSAFSIDYCIPA
jgi:hypothetical protein